MSSKRFKPDRDVAEWEGRKVRYDVAKEVTVCFVVVLLLSIGFAAIFSSPDEPSVTLKSWSNGLLCTPQSTSGSTSCPTTPTLTGPVDFVQTAITELDGTSGTATYGPPYNNAEPGLRQKIGPIGLESLAGVHIPINTAQDFVIGPLLKLPNSPGLDAAINHYQTATAPQQAKWDAAYETAAGKATFSGGALGVPAGTYGPVGTMMRNLLAMAQSGALDGALLANPGPYGTDYTKVLMFIADGGYLTAIADAQHLSGDQWGMMNETGNYPGQAWLWLYTFWYQISPMNSSGNGDALVWGLMMLLTLGLAVVPFIPGLRSIPRWTRVYRLIWKRHYKSLT
jgi:hypothetical protein